MQIEVLLFAAARDAVGADAIAVEVPPEARAADVLAALGQQVPAIASLLPSCRLAVDCSYVTAESAITTDSEIALIPPVSGG